MLAAKSIVESWWAPNVEGELAKFLVSYDADAERFVLPVSALTLVAPTGYGMKKVGEFDPSGKAFSVSLSERNHTDLGSYEASNAMGASVLVSKSYTVAYGVYDQPTMRLNIDSNARASESIEYPRWEYDAVVPAEVSYYRDKPVLYLPVAREQAADLKSRLKIAFSISLKDPFTQIRKGSVEADFQNPREGVVETRLLVANINCAMLMDNENRLIRTISVVHE